MAQRAQSVRFSTGESPRSVNGGRGWTAAAARAWLRAHGFNAPRPDRTENQLRYRQFDPGRCRRDSYKTLTENLPRGVQVVSCEVG